MVVGWVQVMEGARAMRRCEEARKERRWTGKHELQPECDEFYVLLC